MMAVRLLFISLIIEALYASGLVDNVECRTIRGSESSDVNSPSTAECVADYTLVSCGIYAANGARTGSKIDGNQCKASGISGNKVEAVARCCKLDESITCDSHTTSPNRDGYPTYIACEADEFVTGCSVYSTHPNLCGVTAGNTQRNTAESWGNYRWRIFDATTGGRDASGNFYEVRDNKRIEMDDESCVGAWCGSNNPNGVSVNARCCKSSNSDIDLQCVTVISGKQGMNKPIAQCEDNYFLAGCSAHSWWTDVVKWYIDADADGNDICVAGNGWAEAICCQQIRTAVDECTDDTHSCDADNAICIDKQDGYDCKCNEGYSGDGYKCTDLCEGVECDAGFYCDRYKAGQCVRDCKPFDIDGFLTECSDEWTIAGDIISGETEDRIAADVQLQQNIDTQEQERKDADGVLQGNINNEATIRLNAINTEKQDRETADNGLQAAINGEATSRQNAVNTLETSINNEVAGRQAADQGLQGNINNEKQDRETADNALQAAVNKEAADRISSDEGLQSAIDGILERLEGFKEPKKAYDVGMNVDPALNGVNGANATNLWSYKDIIIVMLLVVNLIMMIYVHCISKYGEYKKDKHKYHKVRYIESDVESEANLKP